MSASLQYLTGEHGERTAHTYRIRFGDYRIVYEVLVESKIVEIARVRIETMFIKGAKWRLIGADLRGAPPTSPQISCAVERGVDPVGGR
jgi:hypothetical protein